MQINDKRVKFQIDCGATTNIINKRHAGSNVTPSSKTLKMWNGTEVKPLGTTRLLVRNPKTKRKYSIEFVVLPDNLTPLIGARTAQQMGLITVHTQNFVPVSPPERKKSQGINNTLTTFATPYGRYKGNWSFRQPSVRKCVGSISKCPIVVSQTSYIMLSAQG